MENRVSLTTKNLIATLNGGAEELIVPPSHRIYIVKFEFGFSGGGDTIIVKGIKGI
jgi:hypothetical protein